MPASGKTGTVGVGVGVAAVVATGAAVSVTVGGGAVTVTTTVAVAVPVGGAVTTGHSQFWLSVVEQVELRHTPSTQVMPDAHPTVPLQAPRHVAGVTVADGVAVGVAVGPAATVKLTLQSVPPYHSAALGILVGAVGTAAP